MELAWNRRSGPRCPCPDALWFSPLDPLWTDAGRDLIDHRRRRRRGARLFRRLDGPYLPAPNRNLVLAPASLPFDYSFLDHHAELLRAARHPSVVFLGIAGPCRARGIFARPQF